MKSPSDGGKLSFFPLSKRPSYNIDQINTLVLVRRRSDTRMSLDLVFW